MYIYNIYKHTHTQRTRILQGYARQTILPFYCYCNGAPPRARARLRSHLPGKVGIFGINERVAAFSRHGRGEKAGGGGDDNASITENARRVLRANQ